MSESFVCTSGPLQEVGSKHRIIPGDLFRYRSLFHLLVQQFSNDKIRTKLFHIHFLSFPFVTGIRFLNYIEWNPFDIFFFFFFPIFLFICLKIRIMKDDETKSKGRVLIRFSHCYDIYCLQLILSIQKSIPLVN